MLGPVVRRRVWASCGLVIFGYVGFACSSNVGTEDTVPSTKGFVMPDGGGARISEEDACARISSADRDARQRLSCGARPITCPEYVQPAGSQPCLEYDEATVIACESVIAGYKICADFDVKRCIVSAIPDSAPKGCGGAIDSGKDSGTDVAQDTSEDASGDAAEDADDDVADAGDDGGGDAAAD